LNCKAGLKHALEGNANKAHELLGASQHTATEVGAAEEVIAISGNLALAEYQLGNEDVARRQLVASLRASISIPSPFVLARLLACGTVLLAWEGRAERAVELGALVLQEPYIRDSLYGKLLQAPLADAAAALPPEVVAAAQERGRLAGLQASVRDLLAELEVAMWI
jgi:hypothetical protein